MAAPPRARCGSRWTPSNAPTLQSIAGASSGTGFGGGPSRRGWTSSADTSRAGSCPRAIASTDAVARDRASRPEAKPLRLFLAVEIPAQEKAAVASAIEPWRADFPRARWVPVENWHVTLKFLGSTYPRLTEWIERSVGGVAADSAPFRTRVTGMGAFPSRR